MRAHKVVASEKTVRLGIRFAGSAADSKSKRDLLIEKFKLKKSDVVMEEVEIPTSKPNLLAFINAVAEDGDASEIE